MKMSLILIGALLVSLTAFGNERGNGGDVVVCKDTQGKITSSTILDVYEAKEMRGFDLDLGSSDLSMIKKWEFLFNRVATISPTFSKSLEAEVALFNQEAKFVDNIILNDIPDSDHLYIPKDCQILQIAIQRTPEFPNDRRFVISNDLWKLLDNDNKIALILHEVIYKIAIKNEQMNSKNSRYFNSLIFSGEILKFKGVELARLVTKLEWSLSYITYLHKGFEFFANDYFEVTKKIGGPLVTPRMINLFNNELLVNQVYFYLDESFEGISDVRLACPTTQTFIYKNIVEAKFCGNIYLNTAGSLKAVSPLKNIDKSIGVVVINGQEVQFRGLSFDTNERVSSVIALSPYVHNFFGNTVPLIGFLNFNNGDLDLSPRTSLKIYQDVVMTVGNIRFKMSSDRVDHIKVDGSGRIYFTLDEEVLVKLPNQPEFYCGGKISFFEDGILESCENRGDEKNHDYTKFNWKDGTSTRISLYHIVHFDHDGYYTGLDLK